MAWLAPREGRPGRPPVFSDAAIQVCLSIKGLLKLPLRQTAGMVASLLRLAGLDWPVPDFSTLCRRQKTRAVQIPYRGADGPLNLLAPSRALHCKTLPVNGQDRDQGPRRWRMAGPHARGAGPMPITARQAMQSVAERGRVGNAPGQDLAGVPVHDGDQVEEPASHWQVGDVRRPDLVRSNHLQAAQQTGVNPVPLGGLAGVGLLVPSRALLRKTLPGSGSA